MSKSNRFHDGWRQLERKLLASRELLIDPSDNSDQVKRHFWRASQGHAGLLAGLVLANLCLAVAPVLAASTVFLVRHAERTDTNGSALSDFDLSSEGKTRPLHLAQELKDTRIVAFFASEYRRNQQTAEPLAKLLGVRPEVTAAKDVTSLVARIRAIDGNVLVVGHSNTLPQIIQALGISSPVPSTEADYDNLFVVLATEPPRLIRLHYR